VLFKNSELCFEKADCIAIHAIVKLRLDLAGKQFRNVQCSLRFTRRHGACWAVPVLLNTAKDFQKDCIGWM